MINETLEIAITKPKDSVIKTPPVRPVKLQLNPDDSVYKTPAIMP